MRRNVFSIPPGVPFLETFVNALLNGEITPSISHASAPLDLARATIYLPTQRAGRALAVEFGRALKGPSALLPRILPLGGLDEQETGALFGSRLDADGFDLLAPSIDEIDRRLLLTQLVMQWAHALRHAVVSVDPKGTPEFDRSENFVVASSPASAYALAGELCALIDEFIIENIDWSGIDRLTDDSFDKFWAITAQFLKIALHQWPDVLKERGLVDKAARQVLLIERQIARLAGNSAGAPVIALGSTGANAATARLLAAIARMEHGAVVLPGLDRDLDEESWRLVGEAEGQAEPSFTHPQVMLKRLLSMLDVRRGEVRTLGEAARSLRAREALASEALRPADATENWRAYCATRGAEFAAALDGVTLVEAADEREEALALALFMREALETPERTAALVTPDREIARRAAGELARFEIEIDDSGGKPLGATAVGALARLLAASAQEELSAVDVAALLAHPLVSLGLSRKRVADLSAMAEIAVLRAVGPSPEKGWFDAFEAARELATNPHSYPGVRRVSDDDWDAIGDLFIRLDAAMKPMLSRPPYASLSARVLAHRECLDAVVAGSREESGGAAEGVDELLSLFDRLLGAQASASLRFDPGGYAAFFDALAHETTAHGPRRAHPRLKILGPLEARLLSADLILIAGLDEGVWPPQADSGSLLNRSMRRQLGLTPPERRIGQSTHDFAMAFGARDVVLSRARKRRGSPTVVSRVVARLAALSGDAFKICKQRGDAMLAIAAALDLPQEICSVERPLPCPPLELRPSQLSVTRIETLRRDPYAIYAEHILKLVPLAPLGYEKGAREIGTAIHAALAQFILENPHGDLPLDARERLMSYAKAALDGFLHDPGFRTFNWPRIEAGLEHALAFERERRIHAPQIFVETRGEWTLPLSDGTKFVVSAIADRIEVDEHGVACVFDYKTGKPPSNKQVETGLAPQLTLEAAMIEAGAFERIGKRGVEDAAYIHIGGAGAPQRLEWKDKSFSDVAGDHARQLRVLLDQFRDPQTPYPSRPFVEFSSRFGDYDHLARVKEWLRGGGDDQ